MGAENQSRDPFDLPQEPTLADLFRTAIRNAKLQIRTHLPAKVVAYDPALQKVTVEVGSLQVVRVSDAERLPKTVQSMKGTPPNAEATMLPLVLQLIPVAWPRTSSGYLTFPLSTGDTGELHVQDRSLEQWLTAGLATDPVLAFTHALKDSVFHPGLHSDTSPISPPTDLTATVLDGTVVKIGRGANEAIAKANPLIAALDAFASAVPSPPDGGAAIQQAFKSAWGPPGNARDLVAALKGKVE